jgi:toxin ParE1/3/4
MKFKLVIGPDAEADIKRAANWYQSQQAGLEEDFLAEMYDALERASFNPRHFPRVRTRPEVRRTLLDHFPYRIFFLLYPNRIFVFRVLHSSCHDREWKSAVPKP